LVYITSSERAVGSVCFRLKPPVCSDLGGISRGAMRGWSID
jgi:hypothetical protein